MTQDRHNPSTPHPSKTLIWIALSFTLLVPLLSLISDHLQKASNRQARPDYYAHIDQFGEPITVHEAVEYLNSKGYKDLDLSHVKGPMLVPEGWLLGLVFKSAQDGNDRLYWFVKIGNRGIQDIRMYPGNKYQIPAYP